MKIFYIILKPFFGKKRLIKIWEKVHLASLYGIGCGDADKIDNKDTTGEIKCIKYVQDIYPKDKYVIFDVGANNGQYASAILDNYDEEKVFVYSFEPSKNTFEILKKNTKKYKNIKINNVGISDKKGTAVLYSSNDAERSGLSSLYHRDLQRFNLNLDNEETIKLETIDEYCEKNKIDEIDFLKMDIEGNEYKALLGASKMIKEQKIKAIQFEFGGTNIDSRVFVKDFWDLLSDNYKLYRIVKNGLYEIKEYKETMEIFFCTNFLFIKK